MKVRENLFWVRVRVRVRESLSASSACESIGIGRKQGYRWVKATGGRIPVPTVASSGRFLGQEEHLPIANLRWVVLVSGRSRGIWVVPRRRSVWSCVRNAHPATRSYRPNAAQKRCEIRACRPKPSKLDDRQLAAVVEERLRKNWSPQQISDDLAVVFAGQNELQVSHETIYQSLYVSGPGFCGGSVRLVSSG